MWSHQLRTFPTPENFHLVEGPPKIRGSCGQLKPTPTTAGLRSLALQVFLGPSCSQVTQSWQDLLDSLCFVIIPVGIRRYCSRLLENTDTLWAFRDYYLLAQLNVIWELFCLFVSGWAPETWGSSPKLFPLSASFSCMLLLMQQHLLLGVNKVEFYFCFQTCMQILTYRYQKRFLYHTQSITTDNTGTQTLFALVLMI